MALASASIPDFHLVGPGAGTQGFSFYTYDEDGTNRRENITDWALEHFRGHYSDKNITRWDIFHYVYGILHHLEYRSKYAENLKREMPRIPLAPDFTGFSQAGKELARLHLEYEQVEPWPLQYIETTAVGPGLSPDRAARKGGGAVAPMSSSAAPPSRGHGKSPVGTPALQRAGLKAGCTVPLSYRVEDKMRLAKDRRSLRVNDTLTLGGIQPEPFECRLDNRSALDWVIDQYQVTEDKHSGIRSDPNRPDDPDYIVRLVGQVIRVSVETVKILNALPAL
jgi:predicted helicase